MTITQLPPPAELPATPNNSVGSYPTYAAAQQAVDYLSDAERNRSVMTPIPARPRTYHVAGRTPGTGPVIAVLTDGPTDVAVAAHAADLAARTGTLLITAAAVTTTGFSTNALLHHVRQRRIDSDARAIVARVSPIVHSAGVAHFRTTLPVDPGVDATRALPATPLYHLIGRFGAVAVVTATPLHDPTGGLQPAGPHHRTPTHTTDTVTPSHHRAPSAPW